MKPIVLFATIALLGGLAVLMLQRSGSAPPPAPAQPAATLPGDPCLVKGRGCPPGCYQGPSICGGGGICSQDIACRPAGYDPNRGEKGLLWLDGRAVADRPNNCLSTNPPCPAPCYEGPSRCSGGRCSEDRVCRPHGFDPSSGRLYP